VPSLRRAAPAVIALAAAACTHPLPRAQTVTEAPGGMWIAGSEGLAAFSDGRSVTRHDYPMDAAPDWAHLDWSVYPAARVVVIDGRPWLFTVYADVLRWSGAVWDRIPVRWPGVADTHQVDFAGLGPGGTLLMQFHSDTLAWAEDRSIGARWASESTAPQYYTWLGPVGDGLYGTGFLNQGPGRTLERRAGKARWEVVSALGTELAVGDLLGVVRLPGGPLAVVTRRGMLVVGDGPDPRNVSIASLVAGVYPHPPAHAPLQVAGAAPGATVALPSPPPPPAAAPSQPSPAAPASQPIPPDERRPTLQVAAAPPPPPPERTLWVDAVLQASGHGPMLLVGGDVTAIVEIGERSVSVTQCPGSTPSIVGAATTPAGLRLVTREAALLGLDPEAPCREVAPPAIRKER
jgi:hypothetical protein